MTNRSSKWRLHGPDHLSRFKAHYFYLFVFIVLYSAAHPPATAGDSPAPRKELRSITTDRYQLIVQKDGTVDIRLRSGALLVDNAYPAVAFPDEIAPRPLKVKGLRSERRTVQDRFGVGHGLVLFGENFEWLLNTYPGMPYLMAQLVYDSTGTSSPTLIPWCVGGTLKGGVMPAIAENDRLVLSTGPGLAPDLSGPAITGAVYWACTDSTNRLHLVMGALDSGGSIGDIAQFAASKGRKAAPFCLAVTSTAGARAQHGRTASALACIAVADRDLWTGLRRLAHFAERMDKEETASNTAAAPWCAPLAGTDSELSLCWPSQSGRILYPMAWYTPPVAPPADAAENWCIAQLVAAAISGADLRAACAALKSSPLAPFARRLQPPAAAPAFPADLLHPGGPRVWAQALNGEAGAWTITALFNPDPTDAEIAVDFRALGLDLAAYYTVFEYWPQHFHGMAQRELRFKLPPFSQRLIGLRPAEDRPMLLASTADWRMGAHDHGPVRWDYPSRTLWGSCQVPADTESSLHFYLPDGYVLESATLNGAPVQTTQQGRTVQLECPSAPAPQEAAWQLRFRGKPD